MPTEKVIRVIEKDTVLIKWYLFDGTIYEQKVVVPEKEHRDPRNYVPGTGQ